MCLWHIWRTHENHRGAIWHILMHKICHQALLWYFIHHAPIFSIPQITFSQILEYTLLNRNSLYRIRINTINCLSIYLLHCHFRNHRMPINPNSQDTICLFCWLDIITCQSNLLRSIPRAVPVRRNLLVRSVLAYPSSIPLNLEHVGFPRQRQLFKTHVFLENSDILTMRQN